MKREFDTNYFDPGTGDWVVVDGQIVERDALRIAEKINEYDPNLVLMCLDDNMADFRDAPFVLCERRPNGSLTKIFEAWELDDRILERIFAADQQRFDPLARIESMEAKKKRESESRYKEQMAENLDVLVHAVKNRKSTYTVENHDGDLIRTHEDKPPTRVSSESTVISLGG